MGRRRWRGASTPTPFLLLHPLQPHTHSASIGLSQKTCTYRRKKRALDRVFCVGRAVAKNAHLPSQKTRSGSCFLRRSVLPSQKTLINVQIYAPSGITWVTVAKNAPPVFHTLLGTNMSLPKVSGKMSFLVHLDMFVLGGWHFSGASSHKSSHPSVFPNDTS